MDAIIDFQSFDTNKKAYQQPAIVKELLLEARAGTSIEPTRSSLEPNPIISPGDFSINNEP